MKASRPPPTMPRRRRSGRAVWAASMGMFLLQSKHAAVGGAVGPGVGEIVKGFLGHADDMGIDKGRPFAGAVLGVFQAAFPFDHGPAVIAVLGQLGEDAAEIDLAVTGGAEAAGAVDPGLEAAVDALGGRWGSVRRP